MKILNLANFKLRIRRLGALFFLQLCAIFAVSIFFRIWHLANIPGVNGDEAYIAYKALRLSHGEIYSAKLSWSTNANSVPNFFYTGPLALLHLVFQPSIALMRSVAVVSGLLLLPLNFFLCRRIFDSPTAGISTLIFAVLPIDIAYSRFGWEPSQSVLFTTVAMYLALLVVRDRNHSIKWSILACLSVPVLYVVHATNIFIAPLLLVVLLVRWWPNLLAALSGRARLAVWAALAAGLVVAMVGAYVVLSSPAVRGRLKWHPLSEMPWFLVNYERLFSGPTVYRYISGAFHLVSGTFADVPIPDPRWWDVVLLLAAGGLLLYLCQRLLRGRAHPLNNLDRCLATGWALTVVFFSAVAGIDSILPSVERYALCLVAPTVLVFTRAIVLFMEQHPRSMPVCKILFPATAWALLGSFYIGYFHFIQTTGGESEETFKTGPIETRAVALAYIRKCHLHGTTDYIVTSDWWNDWPVRYLAANDPTVVVLQDAQMATPKYQSGVDKAFRDHSLWFLQFADDVNSQNVIKGLKAGKVPFETHDIDSYGGPVLLRLVRPMPAPH